MAVPTIVTTLRLTHGKAIYCYCEHIVFPHGFPCFRADIIMTSRKHLLLCITRVMPDRQTNAMLIQFNGDSPCLLRDGQSNVQNLDRYGCKICSVDGDT